jgi:hypothetical protein
MWTNPSVEVFTHVAIVAQDLEAFWEFVYYKPLKKS